MSIKRVASSKLSLFVLLSAVVLMASTAQATLHSRLGGLAYYDDVADLTWSADANLNGINYYVPTQSWVSTLTIGGVGGWRLPIADVDGDTIVLAPCSGSAACQDNEMGFLAATYGISYANPSPLNNVIPGSQYWSSSPPVSGFSYHTFNFDTGANGTVNIQTNLAFALPVMSGDVGIVPEPSSALLIGMGLAGLGWGGRRSKYSSDVPIG